MEVVIDSSYRDRNLYPNPCCFNVTVNVPSRNFANSADPVSLEYPVGTYTGSTLDASTPAVLSISGTVTATSVGVVECTFPGVTLFDTEDYYAGLALNGSFRIDGYRRVVPSTGSFQVPRNAPALGAAVTLSWPTTSAPWDGTAAVRFFVPAKRREPYSYIVNETRRSSAPIDGNEQAFVLFTPPAGLGWTQFDVYSFCDSPPRAWSVTTAATPPGSTSLPLAPVSVPQECFVRVGSYSGRLVSPSTVFPPVGPAGIPAGTLAVFAAFAYDNAQSIQYSGTPDQDARTWVAGLSALRIPNARLAGSMLPSLLDYPNLYVEFGEAHTAPRDCISSNNPNTGSAVFRVVPDDASRHSDAFITYVVSATKNVRFSPTAREFRLRVFTPDGSTVRFHSLDSRSPAPPLRSLQISVSFNMTRSSQSLTVS